MAAEESLKHDWIKVTEKNNPEVSFSLSNNLFRNYSSGTIKKEWVRLRSESCMSSLMF